MPFCPVILLSWRLPSMSRRKEVDRPDAQRIGPRPCRLLLSAF
nr:MAG TPA: hypothetical protein [Caudoviricetes sp.]